MCRIILKESKDLFQLPEKVKDLSATLTFTERSVNGSLKSSSSHRSKYLSGSKLTKNGLFSAIKAKKSQKTKETMEELNFELDLLRDTFYLAQQKESNLVQQFGNGLKSCSDECRRVLRGLEHW